MPLDPQARAYLDEVATLGFALYIVIAGHYNALYGSLWRAGYQLAG